MSHKEQSEDDEVDHIPMADEGDDDTDDMAQQASGDDTPRLDSLTSFHAADGDDAVSSEEQEEKARLIAQVLELQNTLDDLSSRVDNVKEENLRLRSENQVLGQYIENLMAASNVFQPANGDPMPTMSRSGGATKKK